MAKDNAKKSDDATEAKAADKAAEGAAAEGAEGEAGGGGKKSKKKMIIIGVAALVALLAAIGGAYFAGLFGGGHQEEQAEAGQEAKPEKPVFYTLPDFLINLNTTGRTASFLKTTIILEVANQEDVPQIEANLPRLVDAINTYLRELRASDLSGSAGVQRLREELLIRANKSLAPVKINDVLFKEIVVQ